MKRILIILAMAITMCGCRDKQPDPALPAHQPTNSVHGTAAASAMRGAIAATRGDGKNMLNLPPGYKIRKNGLGEYQFVTDRGEEIPEPPFLFPHGRQSEYKSYEGTWSKAWEWYCEEEESKINREKRNAWKEVTD